MMKTNKNVIYIVVLGLVVCIPQYFYGLFWSHDFITHLKWSLLFSEQLFDGDLWPRWLVKDNFGFGSPAFYFYPALPYFFSSFFTIFFRSQELFWYGVVSSSTLAIILSGISAYHWISGFAQKNIAFIFAVFYMLSPYHLGIDLYSRFALAELWTFVWIPWILIYYSRVIEGNIHAVSGFIIFYSLLVFTHLPTVIMFTPLIGLHWLLFSSNHIKTALTTSISIIAAFAITSYYWLPAVSLQHLISTNEWDKYAYYNNFLFGNPATIQSASWFWFLLCIILFFSVVAVLLVILKDIKRHILLDPGSRLLFFWLLVFLYAAFMTLPISSIVWNNIPPIQKIQFPWRFLLITTLSSCAIFAIAFDKIDFKNFGLTPINLKASLLLMFFFIAISIALIPAKVISSKKQLVIHDKNEQLKNLFKRFTPPEYLPKGVNSKLLENSANDLVHSDSLEIELSGITNYIHLSKYAQSGPRKHITIKQFYFPSWVAFEPKSKNALKIDRNPIGLMEVHVPQHAVEIAIALQPFEIERYSKVLSIISILGLILFSISLRWPVFVRKRNNSSS